MLVSSTLPLQFFMKFVKMVKNKREQSTSEPTNVKRREIEPESPLFSMDQQTLQAKLWADLESSLKRFTSHYSNPGKTPPSKPADELDCIKTLIRIEGEQILSSVTKSWLDTNEETFSLEMALVVNTITCALVNTRKTDWDAVRFADSAKNTKVKKSGTEGEADKSLRRHFHKAHFKDLMEPTTILNCHGKEDYNKATLGLSKALKKSFTGKTPSWRTTNFKIPDNTLEFEPGIVDFSPGASDTRSSHFFNCIQKAEEILNCIGILACPDLFSTGMASIDLLKQGDGLNTWHDNVKLWPSFFSGIEVVSDRHTPSHHDGQGGPGFYDFLWWHAVARYYIMVWTQIGLEKDCALHIS
ncbi:hypothetical protein DFH94DRAFT_680813 [Russula ochroleuca]|uniref:Uncharacterized protein n=1 Tax=Russula ochroleuca TaxID=152965 RepID=A0A9P5TBI4_9AGAM|nr:hypothetical protein DFH94DRAFT_680813 [Russula ochroleuca]